MTARGTDWSLAALVASLIATGVLTLFSGGSHDAWVFDAHDALGFAIALLLIVKLRRVGPRLISCGRTDRRVAAGVDRRVTAGLIGTVLVVITVASGWLWSDGISPSLAGYSLLAWHDALGAILAVAVAAHMLLRAKPPRARDVADRRQFLTAAAFGVGSVLVWRTQRPVQALFGLRAARRRFTGSYESGSFSGNAFPTTSWVADNPRPIDLESYRLRVGGLVARELALSLRELPPIDELIAALDCTGGFYSTQRWRGIRIAELLERAAVASSARHLRVVSHTGYRWSFALANGRNLLLATHLGEAPLSHDHGAPVRLVVPGARGFQWVKWVERIELLEAPDYGAPASTVWSSFTAAGRGEG